MKRILFLMAIIGMSMVAMVANAANEMTTVATEMTNAAETNVNKMMTAVAAETNAVATDTVYPTVRAEAVGLDLTSARECRAYLRDHEKDTLVSEEVVVLDEDYASFAKGDTVPRITKVFLQNGRLKKEYVYINLIPVYQEEVIVNKELQNSLKAKEAETMVAYKVRSEDNARQDVKYYQYSYGESSGTIPRKYADKDGWYATVSGSYHAGKQTYGFSGMAGFGYEGRMLLGELIAGPERSRYSENADHAGRKYWVLRTEASIMLQPVKFGSKDGNGKKFDQHRLWVGAGTVLRYYTTDSKPLEDGSVVKSKGSEISFVAKLRYEYRFFGTGNSLFVEGFWGPKKTIVQNKHGGPTHDTFGVRVGAQIGINRHSHR